MASSLPAAVRAFLRDEWRQLTTVRPSDRLWPMPFAAALAMGLPLAIGAAVGRADFGLVGSLGGLTFLYLPPTPMHHRMAAVLAAASAMTAAYALGVLSHLVPPLMTPALALTAVLVTMACRSYAVPPPGSLFFIMAASIGAYTPAAPLEIPQFVGLFAMGALLACGIGFAYSLHALRLTPPKPVTPPPPATFDYVVFDSVVVGLSVGTSLAVAQLLGLTKAYWVPVACVAVIQGATLRAIWTRQAHRILGTGLGLLATWGLFLLLPRNPWVLAAAVTALAFVVETAVVRHYAFAAVFITPLAILLADAAAATADRGSAGELIRARFVDTVVGCLVGLAGGACLHSRRFREAAGRPMRRLVPTRLAGRTTNPAGGLPADR